jgi:hypothetical protein
VDKTLLIKKVFQTQSQENDETDIVEVDNPKVMNMSRLTLLPNLRGAVEDLAKVATWTCSAADLEVDKKTGKQITTVDLESETVRDT